MPPVGDPGFDAPRPDSITGLILAGGQGQRMGGVDKGLVELGGQPLVAHVLARLVPQVREILISANRNIERYAGFGHRVLRDEDPEYPGPLAGILQGLRAATTPWLVLAPCDSPFLPTDLVARLSNGHPVDTDIAVVRAAGEVQPVFALLATRLASSLAAYLARGERRIMQWYALHACRFVDCEDIAEAFLNVNTPQEIAAAERQLVHG